MATTPRMKITYATLSADNEELQSSFDAALQRARADLGRTYPMIIGGEERLGDETFEDRSPIDRDLVVARFPKGTREDVRDAIDCGPRRVSGLARHPVARSPRHPAPRRGADQ